MKYFRDAIVGSECEDVRHHLAVEVTLKTGLHLEKKLRNLCNSAGGQALGQSFEPFLDIHVDELVRCALLQVQEIRYQNTHHFEKGVEVLLGPGKVSAGR